MVSTAQRLSSTYEDAHLVMDKVYRSQCSIMDAVARLAWTVDVLSSISARDFAVAKATFKAMENGILGHQPCGPARVPGRPAERDGDPNARECSLLVETKVNGNMVLHESRSIIKRACRAGPYMSARNVATP